MCFPAHALPGRTSADAPRSPRTACAREDLGAVWSPLVAATVNRVARGVPVVETELERDTLEHVAPHPDHSHRELGRTCRPRSGCRTPRGSAVVILEQRDLGDGKQPASLRAVAVVDVIRAAGVGFLKMPVSWSHWDGPASSYQSGLGDFCQPSSGTLINAVTGVFERGVGNGNRRAMRHPRMNDRPVIAAAAVADTINRVRSPAKVTATWDLGTARRARADIVQACKGPCEAVSICGCRCSENPVTQPLPSRAERSDDAPTFPRREPKCPGRQSGRSLYDSVRSDVQRSRAARPSA